MLLCILWSVLINSCWPHDSLCIQALISITSPLLALLCLTHGYQSRACKPHSLLRLFFQFHLSVLPCQYPSNQKHQKYPPKYKAASASIPRAFSFFCLHTCNTLWPHHHPSHRHTASIPKFSGEFREKARGVCNLWTEGTRVWRGPLLVAAGTLAGIIVAIIYSSWGSWANPNVTKSKEGNKIRTRSC